MTSAQYRIPTAVLNAFLGGQKECLGWRLSARLAPEKPGHLPTFVVRRRSGDTRKLSVPYYGRPWRGEFVVGDPVPDDWKTQWDTEDEQRRLFLASGDNSYTGPLEDQGVSGGEAEEVQQFVSRVDGSSG